MAIEEAKASMLSVQQDGNAVAEADQYMTNGAVIEEEKTNMNKQQYKLQEEDLAIKGESDFMANIINQRKEDISNIANIMSDINSIAKDLAIETQKQGEKLERLDENMTKVDENAEDALKELSQA